MPLVAPLAGETIAVGAFTVQHRVCRCCKDPKPMFIARAPSGEIVAMGRSFRGLAHWRRWQLDPVIAYDKPWSWPEHEMNAWQKLCFYLARHDIELGDRPDPITRVHPECIRDDPSPGPRSADPERGDAAIEPEPGTREPTLPRGAADVAGQFSLWE